MSCQLICQGPAKIHSRSHADISRTEKICGLHDDAGFTRERKIA